MAKPSPSEWTRELPGHIRNGTPQNAKLSDMSRNYGRHPFAHSSQISYLPNGNAGYGAESSHQASFASNWSEEQHPEVTVSFPTRSSSQRPTSKEYKATHGEDHIHNQQEQNSPMYNTSSESSRASRRSSDAGSMSTDATSILPALQTKGLTDDNDMLEPLQEEDYDEASYDLVAPAQQAGKQYSLETRSLQLFSTKHLEMIFDHPALLLRFTSFLSHNRQSSIPILIYYLDAVKALKAIEYANAIAEALEPIPGHDFTQQTTEATVNAVLQEKAAQAFKVLVDEDLPAYITHTWTRTVSTSISRRISGSLPLHLREASEGLAEVFCLTDPSRQDNPIVFASEEFHRTTQYGMNYVIGRNCRFLQGPHTNPSSVRRIREKCLSGQEHCEVFLNYRRDGSPFMNLLMTAPLCDSRGKIRYFIGAQVDVSGLAKECSDLESLERLLVSAEGQDGIEIERDQPKKDEFQALSEMLNMQELDTVRRWGGSMHREQQEEVSDSNGNSSNWNKPRVLIHDASPEGNGSPMGSPRTSGKLSGVYEHYLLVRPYPSLRILFASPSLRVPGILQSPFMAKIGGSSRVREELTQAMRDGRGVTAKVRWISKTDQEGRNRWIHCTPLLGSNGAVGVWMVVIVDDDKENSRVRVKQAPPVEPRISEKQPVDRLTRLRPGGVDDEMSLREFAMYNGAVASTIGAARSTTSASGRDGDIGRSLAASDSQWTLKIDG